MDYKEKVIALLNSKELSQEQKEELESIFPELKESEDERTMKELCKAIWTYIPYKEAQKYITWLEKQGKKLKLEPEEKNEKIRKGLIKAFRTVGKFEWGGLNVQDILIWLEKQGEQNTLNPDKVIEWLKPYGCVVDNIVEQFKKDFGL